MRDQRVLYDWLERNHRNQQQHLVKLAAKKIIKAWFGGDDHVLAKRSGVWAGFT